MILIYRPELQNPPMAKESTIGFSFINKAGSTQYIDLEAGVNRDFPKEIWDKIKEYDVVKNLLSLEALRVKEDEEVVPEPEAKLKGKSDSITNMHLSEAMDMIENSFDIEQLQRWDVKDQRIRVKQAIARRITKIQGGDS